MNKKKRKYQSGKIRTFLLFLFLACIIWVLTKFSKELSASVSARLVYVELPANSVLAEGNPGSITFDMTGTGYDFLLYKIKPLQIEVEVDRYYQEQKDEVLVDNSELVRLIARALDGKKGIRNLSINQLRVDLDKVAQKRVPVKALTDLAYREGFRPLASPGLTPDSVTLSGPAEKLRSVDSLTTEKLVRDNVDTDISASLLIRTELPEGLTVTPKEVELFLEVEEYSPKSLSIPVQLINAPDGLDLKLVPATVNLSFDIPISLFNEVDEADFQIVCDYLKRNEEENFMLPELVEKHENAVNLVLGHNKIDYLIFKKDN